MPKKIRKTVLRQIIATEYGVSLFVADGKTGKAYVYRLLWDDLEKFAREHGEAISIGEFSRSISGHVRNMMESDDD